MSKLLCLVLVLLLVAVVPSSVTGEKPAPQMVWPDRGKKIVVMTFNLRTSQAPEDGVNGWIFRILPVSDMIRLEAPDVIALQEADTWQIASVLRVLPGYVCITGNVGDQDKGYPTILVRADRIAQRSSERLWLSAVPQMVDSRSWGNTSPRCYTSAELVDRFTGRAFSFTSTHFDYKSQATNKESAKLLASVVRSRGVLPVILAGDFNEKANSKVLNPLRPHLLSDSYALAGQPEEGTLHGFTGKAKVRLDMILVSSEWRVISSRVVKYHRGGNYPSDHFPVVATLELRAQTRQRFATKP